MIPHSRPWLTSEDMKALSAVFSSSMISKGPTSLEFAGQAAEFSGYSAGFSASSGGQALELGLRALGIGHGDEVILPTYVCKSVLDAVSRAGAKPVVCDVSNSWVMQPDNVTPLVSTKTRAIILVHIFGIDASHPDYATFEVPIVHDLCQSFGMIPKSQGVLAFTSLNATKCLTAGEGGVLMTSDSSLAGQITKLVRQGHGGVLSDIAAALGIAQLSRYPSFLSKREALLERYSQIPGCEQIIRLSLGQGSPPFRFPVRIPWGWFDDLRVDFEKEDIAVRRGVDSLVHWKTRSSEGSFERATELFNTTLSIPFHASLNDREQDQIIEVARRLLTHG